MYLLFVYDDYYAGGGAFDIVAKAETLEEIKPLIVAGGEHEIADTNSGHIALIEDSDITMVCALYRHSEKSNDELMAFTWGSMSEPPYRDWRWPGHEENAEWLTFDEWLKDSE